MNIAEIYQAFNQIGCLTFSTVDKDGIPHSRIAHLRAYDEQGIYFMTMHTKDFYRHLKHNGQISLCGLNADSQVKHDEQGFPIFDLGYAIRMSGKAQEVSIAEIKAKNNPLFDFCLKDQQIYPAMVVFCISEGYGDIFDYDFHKQNRSNKLNRKYFAFGGAKIKYKGLTINQEQCIGCGKCYKKCSFAAIKELNNKYTIDVNHCDECGDCLIACPLGAIEA